MQLRKLAITAGISYLIIFFAAIFANFFVIELILKDPAGAIKENNMLVRFGILSFIIVAVLDVVVAWALYKIYRNHHLTRLSTYFRIIHACIMGVAVSALPVILTSTDSREILRQVDQFNFTWLIGLFFFGAHLILLGTIMRRPAVIPFFLITAGVMYMIDTSAHFLLPGYKKYASVFLAFVAIPSIVGEMSLAIWLLVKAGRGNYLTVEDEL